MKHFKTLLCLTILAMTACLPAAAQTARQVLDRTATKLHKAGGVQASFVATTYKGLKAQGSTNGRICVKGNKFRLSSSAGTTWFNGKTMWALQTGGDEAYVSTPTAAELQSTNPYTFVDLYRSGYNLKLHSTSYNGKACHEVELTANGGGRPISRMLVTIDKKTSLPLCIRVKPAKGEWVRLQVTGLQTGRNWPDSYFNFNAKDHPKVQLIDLR